MTVITTKTITPKALKTIVADWQEELPMLGIWKKQWLVRRVGPIVVGVCIDVLGGRRHYRPTAFMDVLVKPELGVTFGLPRYWSSNVGDCIRPQFHDRHYRNAAAWLCEHAYVPLDRYLHPDDLIEGYTQYLRDHPREEFSQIPEQTRLMILCREPEEANKLLSRIKDNFKPDDFDYYGGRDALVDLLEREMADPRILDRMVAEKVEVQELGEVPYSDLIT